MKRLLIIVAALVVVVAVGIGAVVAIQLLRSDDPDLLTSAPQIPTPSATSAVATVVSTTGVTPTLSATTTTAGTTPTVTPGSATSLALHFTIDAGSSAKYVVREKLAALPVSSDAVGTTSDITGDLYLTPAGLASGQTSSFKVDLRTLKTDEALRDRFVRDQTLQTGRFPTADFVVTGITPFPTNYVEGTEVSISITGNMTIHGVTKPLTFTSKARRQGGSLTGIADVDFKMSDFNITPPNVQLAKSEDGIHLQIVIVAKLAV